MEGSGKTSYESPITKRIMEGSSCSSEPLEKAWNLTIIGQLSYQFSKYLVAVPKERLPIPKGDPKPVKRKGLVADIQSTENSKNSHLAIEQFVSETLVKNLPLFGHCNGVRIRLQQHRDGFDRLSSDLILLIQGNVQC